MSWRSAIYTGRLIHVRRDRHRDHFAYPICFFGFDVDELPRLGAALRLFGHNRPGAFSVYDRDYTGAATGLRNAAVGFARRGGVREPIERIELVTQARVAGYVFNPVSFHLLYGAGDRLICTIAEVANTYGGRHRYLLSDATRQADGSHRTAKAFYVSPYIHQATAYEWTIRAEGARRVVAMDVLDGEDRRFFRAVMRGRAQPLSDGALARLAIRYPLMTVRILGLIHWHALLLRRRGVAHHPPPARDTLS